MTNSPHPARPGSLAQSFRPLSKTSGNSRIGAAWQRLATRVLRSWTTAYTHALRVLLVLLIATHCVLLCVLSLRCLELAWFYSLGPGSLGVMPALGAAGLTILGLLFAQRFLHATAALLTSRNDHRDEVVAGTRLDPAQHAALFQKVKEVAGRMAAPVPNEIWVSDDARCFAFEQRNFAFLTTRRVLVLVLGLPHLLIMRSDELAVIVGHELTHFRQQDTTLAVFLFRFSHALRNSLDAAGNRWLPWLNPALWIEWASYQFFCLLIAPVQRGQEIAADSRSAEVFGGDVARRTLLREWFVANRFEALIDQRMKDSDSGIEDKTRTIYQQFLDEWQEVSQQGQQFLQERLEDFEEESYWDSHPALKQRLAAVSAYPNFGADPSGPASDLLGDVPLLLEGLGHTLPKQESPAEDSGAKIVA